MLNWIFVIFGISLLVVVHEAGHYLAARASGMRVTRFSIGFGPVIVRYQPKGSPTIFQICAVPLLAYVAISGMNPAEEMDPNDPEIYPNKGLFARSAMVFAGPFANYLVASIMIFFLGVFSWPESVPTEPMIISDLEADFPAKKAGLQVGDIILEANGEKIKNIEDLSRITKPRAGKSTDYLVQRGKEKKTYTITPTMRENRGFIGVSPKYAVVYRQLPISDAAIRSVVLPFNMSVANLLGIVTLIKERSTEGIAGPVGIAKIAKEHAEKGVADFAQIMIWISIALGMFNLLPLPALDGGRLVFLGFEAVTRRRANERIEALIHTAGLLFFLGLLVLITWRDIARFFPESVTESATPASKTDK
jgi:regulator of sigma E protease